MADAVPADAAPAAFAAALRDRYRIERELGRGGMATVYLAHDLRHHRFVALKALDRGAAMGAERFLREIEIAAGLVHPHIVGLLDSGEASDIPYYVMPYVPGDSLRARLRREGELPLGTALQVLREVVDALGYAHAAGVVHRDLKPENVLFLGPHALIADFGVAKALRDAGAGALTTAGMAIGTPTYMAPEQAAGDLQLDHRADIYAAGLLGYEMLAGAPPFSGGDAMVLMAAHVTRAAEPLERVRPAVPAALAAVIMRCLAKRPADRWQSADELLRQLDAAAASISGSSTATSPREIEDAAFRLNEAVCRQLDRASFDPRLIGDALHYRDNHAQSDVLVACLPACGMGAESFQPLLRSSRYRAIAVTPLGMEAARRRRPSLTIDAHIVLLREWLRAMIERSGCRVSVLLGFSSGADLALRLAAAAEPEPALRLDGCLALGANLSLETCFVTRVLAGFAGDSEAETLAALKRIGEGSTTLEEWTNVHEYLVSIVSRFRNSLDPLKVFAADVVRPFATEGPLAPFAAWYRAARARGRRLTCVFEDSRAYHELVRELQLRNHDEGLLGDRYEEDSIVIDPDTTHFDLVEAARVERHLAALVQGLRG